MTYDAVIFDKDGILIDSTEHGFEWGHRLRAKLLSERGRQLDFEEAAEVARADEPSDLDEFLESNDLTWEDLSEAEKKVAARKKRKIQREHIQLYPHVRDVLQAIDLPMVVVSNAPKRAVDFVMDYYALEQYFEKVVAPPVDDMKRFVEMKKPSTEMMDAATEGLDAENPIMIGDSSADIRMAENAGIDCCLVNPYKEYPELDPEYRFESAEGLRQIPDVT